MSAAGNTIRRRVVYFGRVQGVGFRYTAYQLADGRTVVGFVKNRPDGSVELEAEGAPEEVTGFLSDVAEHFHRNIDEAQMIELPPNGREAEFEIVT